MKKWLLLIPLFGPPLMAAEIPPGSGIEILSDFSGGLNTSWPSHKVDPKFSPYSRNVFVHRNLGRLKERNGYTIVGSSFSLLKVTYGFTFNKADGSKEFLVSDSSIALSTKDYNTYVLVSSAMNTNTNLECTELSYKLYCTNGVDPVFTWDGTSKVNLDGTLGTPNAPRGRYITSFLNRIWLGNTSADPSSLDWSATVSTNGTIITPDNFLAWPAINHHSVGQGDGESLTALWVYQGKLQIGKDNSIYTEYGDRDSNFIDRKTVSQAGCSSQDSVVVLDGISYFKGKNGVYAYDGTTAQRISDLIKPDVEAMLDPSLRIVQNVWESQSQFGAGNFYGSTATPAGILQPATVDYGTNYFTESDPVEVGTFQGYFVTPVGTLDNSDPGQALSPSTTFYGPKQLTFDNTKIPKYSKVYLEKAAYQVETQSDAGCLAFASMTVVNRLNGEIIQSTATNVVNLIGVGGYIHFYFKNQNPVFEGFDLQNSSMEVKVEGCNCQLRPMSTALFLQFRNATTVQYVSEVSTITTLTGWGNFDSLNNPNLGTVRHYIRTSTSVVNIATQTWMTITPGVTINAPIINKFVQWASTLTSVSSFTNTTNIDRVAVNHLEGSGGSENRAFATDWNNEYWLTVSTNASSNLKLQYVKSWITNPNPNAWNPLSGYNIASIWKDGATTLYGGSSSTGTIFRLDYGTNDNGQAINAFYDTPDMSWNKNWIEDQLFEIWLDAQAQDGKTLNLGLSVDGGDFTYDSIDLSGVGRVLPILRNHSDMGKSFRFRFQNNQLDKGLDFDSLGIVHTPLKTR